MQISIVTPSFRSAQWLPLCIASVADQHGVNVQHIVQDSCSDDGTAEILKDAKTVEAYIEKDKGMYDAVNRGMTRASGEILAYLNCDEQYLPGALKLVHDFFADHPELDAVVADTIVTDSDGQYICTRCSLVPTRNEMWVRFPVLTSSLFLRRRVFHEMGIHCDIAWRDLGDWVWVMEMVKRGVRFGLLPSLTSVFVDTGENMNLKPNALKERRQKWNMAPGWVRMLKYPFIASYRMRLAARGAMSLKPFDFALYTRQSRHQRVNRHVEHPTSFWKTRKGM